MPAYTEPRCSNCGNLCSKELLTGKRVQFYSMMTPKRADKSVTIAWLCESCLKKDPEFNKPAYSGPGHTSNALERVKVAREERRKS